MRDWFMPPTRRKLLTAAGTMAFISGCLGDDDDSEDDPTPTPTPEETPTPTPVATYDLDAVSHPEIGAILVDGNGMTLYMFDADEQGADVSECYDDCADNWPPLSVEDDPAVSDSVTASISTFERDDGNLQATADGWPLYYWIGDDEAGDINGQGVNDVWWVLDPDGKPIRAESADDGDGNDGNGDGY